METVVIILLGFVFALGSLLAYLYYIKPTMDAEIDKPVFIPPEPEPQLTNAEKLVKVAVALLGKDASPMQLSPQELSCAEGVSFIIHQVFPDFPANVVSTIELDSILDNSPHYFKDTKLPGEGCIIISPREDEKPGHCGIFVTNREIASNDSATGLFISNYTWDSWVKTFREKRGLKHIFLYQPLG